MTSSDRDPSPKTGFTGTVKWGQERVLALLNALGDPQKKLRVIHIAGTNGKGSFGALLSSVLCRAGYRTGSFSSPALLRETDAFRIGGRPITQKEFNSVVRRVRRAAKGFTDAPTDFELLTAAAFFLFEKHRCDPVLIECGMGGDGDATNVIDTPLLSVITNVTKDHTALLGNSVAQIAAHKAGIIKPGRPVLFGGDDPAAKRVVAAKAKECGAPLFCPDPAKISRVRISLTGTRFRYEGQDYRLSLLGECQVRNALNALCAIRILRAQGVPIDADAVREGLAAARWKGRFELLRRRPAVLFDGAHNPDGFRTAVKGLEQCFGETKCILLTGVMGDKDYTECAALLAGRAAQAVTVRPDNPRALDPERLAAVYRAQGIPAQAAPSVEEGVLRAYRLALSEGLPLVVLGSLYLYKEFLPALKRAEQACLPEKKK